MAYGRAATYTDWSGALDPGADDRDVHGVEQPGVVMMPLEWLGIVMADNLVRTGDEARQLWP
jgi:hypothetical protein